MSAYLQNYLGKYAEPDSSHFEELTQHLELKYVIVIPVFNENSDFLDSLAKHTSASELLAVVVINEPASRSPNRQNQELLAQLQGSGTEVKHNEFGSVLKWKGLNCLVIDRTDRAALPDKQGVGLARKIGCDVALQLIHQNRISQAFIHSSDADATLPEKYFAPTNELTSLHSAVVYDFEHIGDHSETMIATHIYEECIKYYTNMLVKAGSPYGFHSLGSCLAVSAKHYAIVRGFPKKSGAEDFYILNKLAKVGNIYRPKDVKVKIKARISDRVPFGTGPAVKRIMEQRNRNELVTYFNIRIFDELQKVLSSTYVIWENIEIFEQQCSSAVLQALNAAGLREFVKKRKAQDKTLKQFQQSFNAWFDAFQTLKFVRRLEELEYSPQPVNELFKLVSDD